MPFSGVALNVSTVSSVVAGGAVKYEFNKIGSAALADSSDIMNHVLIHESLICYCCKMVRPGCTCQGQPCVSCRANIARPSMPKGLVHIGFCNNCPLWHEKLSDV